MGIKQELERFAGQVGFTLAYLDETTSTNDVARDRATTPERSLSPNGKAADADSAGTVGAAPPERT